MHQPTQHMYHFGFLFGTPFHHPVQACVSFWKTRSSCTRGSALLVVTHPVTLCANCRHRSHRSLCLALLSKCSSRYAGHSMVAAPVSCPTHCLLCVTRFGIRCLDIRRGFLLSTCGLMMSARIVCPCVSRPRLELGLSLRVPRVSAKRDRQS